MSNIVILGAGITGLSSALKLSAAGHKVTVLEKNSFVGGLSASFRHRGFTLDYGPHKLFTLMPHIKKEIDGLLGSDCLEMQKKSRLKLSDSFFSYPVKFFEVLSKMGIAMCLRCLASYTVTSLKPRNTKNYESYVTSIFGKEMYRLLFEAYAIKVWGNPEELSYELAKTRIIVPNLLSLLTNKLFPTKVLSSDKIYYPKYGFGELAEKICSRIKANNGVIVLGADIKKIKNENGRVSAVTYAKGGKKTTIDADFVISTIPLYNLPGLFDAPPEIISCAKNLQYQELVIVYIMMNRDKAVDEHWIFYPESRYLFNRLSEQKNFSQCVAPKGKTVLALETTNPAIVAKDDKEITKNLVSNFLDTGIVSKDEVEDVLLVRVRDAYPLYKKDFREPFERLMAYLDKFGNFITNGRQGLFNYNNVDHCMDMGFNAADCIIRGKNWKDVRKDFAYRIID